MTESFLIFCTAKFDVQVVEDFLLEAGRVRDAWESGWLLVRSPQEGITGPILNKGKIWWPEERKGWPDCPPIEPFETGFLDWSVEDLGQFVFDHAYNRSSQVQNLPDPPSWQCFVVLDERSARDGTALVYDYHQRIPTEILRRNPDIEDETLEIDEWVEWRMRFLHTTMWMIGWVVRPAHYCCWCISKDEYFDADGVLQQPGRERRGISKQYTNFAGLTEEMMVPYGPEQEPFRGWTVKEERWLKAVEQGLIKVYPGPRQN